MENKKTIMSSGGGVGSAPPTKVSVAMATYNGEKYIEEQLLSICRQTRRVDEIVVSDDGSKDKALEIVRKVSQSEDAAGIDFVILTDNPRHGCGGNFDWALKHTSGDIVFICGQDDLWLADKVEQVEYVFNDHSDALCVLHNAEIINSAGQITGLPFLTKMDAAILTDQCPEGRCIKLDASLLEQCVSRPIISGVAIALRRDLVLQLSPIPVFAEDQWIEFMALLNDGCYFTNQILTFYRKHESNTSGSRATGMKRLLKLHRGIAASKKRKTSYMHMYELGKGFIERLSERKLQHTQAYGTAKRIYEIGTKKADAFSKGGILGSFKLINLYIHDIRYRRIGFWSFFYDLIFVLRKEKSERN